MRRTKERLRKEDVCQDNYRQPAFARVGNNWQAKVLLILPLRPLSIHRESEAKSLESLEGKGPSPRNRLIKTSTKENFHSRGFDNQSRSTHKVGKRKACGLSEPWKPYHILQVESQSHRIIPQVTSHWNKLY